MSAKEYLKAFEPSLQPIKTLEKGHLDLGLANTRSIMVTAAQGIKAALHHGYLEKKKRIGWRKKYFILTRKNFMYFDSNSAKGDARAAIANVDVITVQNVDTDPEQRSFRIVLFKKKKEYRAADSAERDAWVRAIEPVIGYANDVDDEDECREPELPACTEDLIVQASVYAGGGVEASKSAQGASTTTDREVSLEDLTRLCEDMMKAMKTQISKTVSSSFVLQFVKQKYSVTHERAIVIAQALIEAKLLFPLKSHTFDDNETERYRFQNDPENLKNGRASLTLKRSKSITERMSRKDFVAQQYAEEILRKNSSEKLENHCQQLKDRKEKTVQAMKEEISASYQSFIRASTEIKKMESSMADLKTLVMNCKCSLLSLKHASTELRGDSTPKPSVSRARRLDKREHQGAQELYNDLLVYFNAMEYDDFMHHLQKFKQLDHMENSTFSAQVDQLETTFIQRLQDDFASSMHTSERIHKSDKHLHYLIQLGKARVASEMCFEKYTHHITLQLRHVPSSGDPLRYIIDFSRTFFSTILVCYEDLLHCFKEQESTHFLALTTWISSQLQRFALGIRIHIFPGMLDGRESRGAPESLLSDVTEHKEMARSVSNALRNVFYGSRQLELAGLPTAHCLAPHFLEGLKSFLNSYKAAIMRSIRDEVKRERWGIVRHTIRSIKSKEESDIHLTQSARSFYTMIQQFLRDAQRILSPTCATYLLPKAHHAVVTILDELLIHYMLEVKTYLEISNLSSMLRPKQIAGALTDIAYLQTDCAARTTSILDEFIAKSALLDRNLDILFSQLWKGIVQAGMERSSSSILKMTIQLEALDLTERELPSIELDQEDLRPNTLILEALMNSINEISNPQLEQSLEQVNFLLPFQVREAECWLVVFVLGDLVQRLQRDEHFLDVIFQKKVGWGGLHRLIAELCVLCRHVAKNSFLEQQILILEDKAMARYHRVEDSNEMQAASASEWKEVYIEFLWHQARETVNSPCDSSQIQRESRIDSVKMSSFSIRTDQ
uniref:Exocyst complex component 8 n=1 Tax=Albugo laibachii Nc14 TaxID=890382 RepID=F0WR53_9STRA|nr:conserved hypothetical protein [Albugo laibachii Nc14]|eukprot:CCA23813.1 conserved hypothetical protein [Albugo laibachii Nc14]